MKVIGRILRYLGFTLLGLLAALLVVAGTLWAKPGLVCNERAVRWALARFAPDFHVSWTDFHWRIEPRGWWAKRSDLELRGLCLKMAAVNGCFERVAVDLTFSLKDFQPRITLLEKVAVQGRELTFSPNAEPAPAHDLPLPDLRLGSFASYFPDVDLTRIRELELSLPKITVAQEQVIVGSLQVHKESAERSRMHLLMEWGAAQGKQAELSGVLRLSLTPEELGWEGKLRARSGKTALVLPLRGTWKETLALTGTPELRLGRDRYRGKLALELSGRALAANLSDVKLPRSWPGRNIKIQSCRVESKLDQSAGFPQKGNVECAVEARARARKAVLPFVRADVKLKFRLAQVRSDVIAADLDVDTRATQDIVDITLNGHGRVEFAGGKTRLLDPSLQFLAKLPRFDLIAAAVDKTAYAVPAPFQDFRGPITVKGKLSEGATMHSLGADIELETNLGFAVQKLITAGHAHVQLTQPFGAKPKTDIQGELVLRDVAVSAPPARLEPPPQVGLDDRFVRKAPVPKKKAGNLHWRLAVRNEQPVRILTNLQKSSLPLAVHLTLRDNAKPEGTIELLPMPLQIFGRKMRVDHLDLGFRPNSELIDLNGVVVYQNPEATVRILFLGTTDEPRIDFESDPPLNQQQIISLLLFNKSIAELTEEEASSTTSMGQAISSGAFGLFSLFFLSSTPIESVGYDPATGAYSVRVRLGSRTTVSAASDLEETRTFGLRHRLGKQWAISTELHTQDEIGSGVLTLLEWFKRF